MLSLRGLAASQDIERAIFRRGHEPCPRIVRDARLRPPLERRDERVLCELFGQTDVAHHAREAGDEPGLDAPHGVDRAMGVPGHHAPDHSIPGPGTQPPAPAPAPVTPPLPLTPASRRPAGRSGRGGPVATRPCRPRPAARRCSPQRTGTLLIRGFRPLSPAVAGGWVSWWRCRPRWAATADRAAFPHRPGRSKGLSRPVPSSYDAPPGYGFPHRQRVTEE